eukprot:CAMPEP_0198260052 /NCGR_PEP_ID=MMETSP1447-20131203/9097_1 /TAXON_ID=420782 /ORGANISM="Chaetoceros dichaeta, Strain CCMP1751" /LENGTH=452 /DNA_ID=CAMNT_0043947607 /DNA_START=82 /DNA_END=1436 /DNA_ORIENTATION=+
MNSNPSVTRSKKCVSRLVPVRLPSVLLLQVFCYQMISALQIPNSIQCHSRHCALMSTSRLSSTLNIDSMDAITCASAESSPTWSMTEDWALVDIVPKYTVYGSSSSESISKGLPYTFWTQLLHSTPELSQRTEREALLRYRELCRDPTRYSSSSKEMGVKQLPRAGSSPPLLRDWGISEKGGQGGSGSTFLGGTLIDTGSRVWFPLHAIGCLGNNPANIDNLEVGINCLDRDLLPTMNPSSLVGGFAEAAGGKVYELGDVARQSSPSITSNGAANFYQRYGAKEQEINFIDIFKPILSRMTQRTTTTTPSKNMNGSTSHKKFSASTVSAVSALFASSILSVFIGFEVGIAGATVGVTDMAPHPTPLPTMKVVQSPCPYMQSSLPLSSITNLNTVEPSVSELRARQEAKVYRERRAIQDVSRRLKFDEEQLAALEIRETAMLATQTNYEYDSV